MVCANLIHIEAGWEVQSGDGHRVGRVEELGPGYLVVSRGVFLPTELFVPVQAVRAAEPDRRLVELAVSEKVVDAMGWDEPDVDAGADGGW